MTVADGTTRKTEEEELVIKSFVADEAVSSEDSVSSLMLSTCYGHARIQTCDRHRTASGTRARLDALEVRKALTATSVRNVLTCSQLLLVDLSPNGLQCLGIEQLVFGHRRLIGMRGKRGRGGRQVRMIDRFVVIVRVNVWVVGAARFVQALFGLPKDLLGIVVSLPARLEMIR